MNHVIGADFGTDSVRAVVIDAATGREVGTAVSAYPRWKAGRYCVPSENRFRQHPRDYLEGLEAAIKGALAACPPGTAATVRGISVDTTGSTPVAVDRKGMPLALDPAFEDDPDAMFILWKDHSSLEEAEEINRKSRAWPGGDYTRYVGGIYSSEWFWAKIMHTVRTNPRVKEAAWTWIEHADWIPALLAGISDADRIPRGRCAWGHKGMWHESWGGLPPADYLAHLDPYLATVRERTPRDTWTADRPVGKLCPDWAKRLGLGTDVVVGGGAFDCHMGAVGAGVSPRWMVKVIGTSTCDIMCAPYEAMEGKVARGICGQVDGSVIPGMVGLEAGQSAFGDLYAWFRNLLLWPFSQEGIPEVVHLQAETRLMEQLNKAAAALPVTSDAPLALDWINGRRTPDANQRLTAAFTGMAIGTGAPELFQAVVEASAFGAKAIAERFVAEGVPIDGTLAIGGVARKSPYAMQVLADVLGMPIRVCASDQAVAVGAGIFAAVAAGLYPDVPTAIGAMACGVEKVYEPDAARHRVYQERYARYRALGDFVEAQAGGMA